MIASNYFFYGSLRGIPRVARVGGNLISLAQNAIVRFP